MFLKTLQLNNFRNFPSGSFEFGRRFNIFVGSNAQGKTNILESIALISSGKSFRTSDFRDMISWDGAGAFVRASVEGPKGSDELVAVLSDEGKVFKRNGKRARPNGPKFILFAPEEILLLKDTPSARRKYTDTFAAGFSPVHKKYLREYERTLSQRNRLIQDDTMLESRRIDLLSSWDEQLVRYGTELVLSRRRWLEMLNEELPIQYGAIAPNDGDAIFGHKPFCGEDVLKNGGEAVVEFFMSELIRRRSDEFIRRTTLVGPHKDDVVARIGGSEVKRFGSQGQHRSFVLALKIAEVELHRKDFGSPPILLLDDVTSELDEKRNRHFFDYLAEADGQIFITTTDASQVMLTKKSEIIRFDVSDGSAVLSPQAQPLSADHPSPSQT
jgi:DNA replication and repair protein RecF